jgi:predicted neutral ceramidase superfamily lipid hydrolase
VRSREKEALAKLRYTPPPEYTGERRLPWPIDILLYPANAAGLTNLAVVVGILFLLTLVQRLVFLPFLGLMFFLAKLAIAIYAAWYWAECTYDSAQGGTRAPQILDAAGYGDKWSRVSYLLAAYIIFVLPTILYPLYGGRNITILCTLLAWAIVFFPMGLLAMVMHEALYVLNPLFLLGSIFRTFIPYLGLLLLIASQAVLFRLVLGLLMQGGYSIWLAGLGSFTTGYSSLIAAHILGRFYWRYRERLDWGL